jgi:hypothetical protein
MYQTMPTRAGATEKAAVAAMRLMAHVAESRRQASASENSAMRRKPGPQMPAVSLTL